LVFSDINSYHYMENMNKTNVVQALKSKDFCFY